MVVPRSRDRSFYGSVFRSLFRFSSLLSLETCVGVSKTQADEFVMNRRRTSSREAPTFHPTAWKWNSRKFAVASDSSTRFQPLDNRRWCSPPAPKRGDLVAIVAPMCIKGLRLVTMQLAEKFSPVGVGTNRSSHIRLSRKFANGTSTSVSLIRLTESLLWGHRM